MTSWSQTQGDNCHGDIGFGSTEDSSPTVTYAELLSSEFHSSSSNVTFPGNNNVYSVDTTDNMFRMQFTERCGQNEGWMWRDGMIFVR